MCVFGMDVTMKLSSPLWHYKVFCLTEDTVSVVTYKKVPFGLIWPQNSDPLWNSPFAMMRFCTVVQLDLFKLWLPLWKSLSSSQLPNKQSLTLHHRHTWRQTDLPGFALDGLVCWLDAVFPQMPHILWWTTWRLSDIRLFFLRHQEVLSHHIAWLSCVFSLQSTETWRRVLWTCSMPLPLERKGIFPRWQSVLPLLPVVCIWFKYHIFL